MEHLPSDMPQVPRAAYERIALRLSSEAERNAEVSTYLSADDIANALGDKGYDPDMTSLGELRKWIERRITLGFNPSADDILTQIEEMED